MGLFQDYMEKCTQKALKTLEVAITELVANKLSVLTPEFILLALISEPDSEAVKVLRKLTDSPMDAITQLRAKIRQHYQNAAPSSSSTITASPAVASVLKIAHEEAKQLGDEYISTGTLFVALFDQRAEFAARCLNQLGLDRQQAHQALVALRGGRTVTSNTAESEADVLAKYTRDLTALARAGELDPVIGREQEIQQIIQTLSRRKKNNPALIGEAGVGKTVIVEGLAQRIANADVPDTLLNKRLLSLDMGEVVAGTKMHGEFEERLKSIRDAVIKAKGQVILFLDELHTVVGAGAGTGGLDAPSLLKTALSQGSLQVIGADTLDEYHRYVEADKALERRFHPILVREPSIEQTIEILTGICPRYEAHHHVSFDPAALDAAANMAERYLTDRKLPDKAVDLIDEAGSRKHIQQVSIPNALKSLEQKHRKLSEDKTQAFLAEQFEQAASLQVELLKVEEKLKAEREQWQAHRDEQSKVVVSEDIAAVVSRWTGIPLSRLVESESDKLSRMEDNLHKRIIGQDDAVQAVSNAIRRNRAGITSSKRPIGSFLFLGPTGVGKTELARALAAFLLDDEARIVRLDMSEYMERHEVSKMIGAPPGYTGYGEGGQLTEKVRRSPYTVVLFDEMEKAHPDVFNMLLQILEDGQLTDAQGRTVSFRNTILVGTSNLGTESLTPDKHQIGFMQSTGPDDKQAKNLVLHEVKKFFKPEFLNRLDDLIVFHYLEQQHVLAIARLFIDELIRRMQVNGVTLTISDQVIEKLARDGFDPIYGARPLRREVERQVENPLAMLVVKSEVQPGQSVDISVKQNEILCTPQAKGKQE